MTLSKIVRLIVSSNSLIFVKFPDIFPKFSINAIIAVSLLTIQNVQADSRLPDFARIFKQQSPAVVSVTVSASVQQNLEVPNFNFDLLPEPWRFFFEPPTQDRQPSLRQGSGFILSEDGYIISNAHVVANATDIKIGLQNQREYTAELIGTDVLTDVALLKIDAQDLTAVMLGDSDTLRVGQWLLAVGAPFGFDYTATQGIVSAVARNLPSETYVPFIQTDAAVNPGNSGGPLFDTEGKVVGVNSQIYSRTGGYQGLSFAIPINVVKNVVEQLRTSGNVSRGWLGVMIQSIDQELAESFGLNRPAGALVTSVTKGSPAEKADLKSGDIILEFNGRQVATSGALAPMVGVTPVGTIVPLKILRDGKQKTIKVTIAELVTNGAMAEPSLPKENKNVRLGLVVENLTANQLRSRGLDHGVIISEVVVRSPAANAGLRLGDVIVSLNQKLIRSVSEFENAVKEVITMNKNIIPVMVLRDGMALYLAIRVRS